MELVDEFGQSTYLGQANFEPTGGWQEWTTTTEDIDHIDAGIYTLRVTITASPFNLNWFEFEFEGEVVDPPGDEYPFQLQRVVAYPNPASDQVNVAFALIFRQDLTMVVYNSQGQLVYGEHFEDTSEFQTTITLEGWASGVYQVFVIREDGTVDLGRFVKG